MEVWKRINGFPDYEISNQGRVKSFKKWRGTNERILTPGKNSCGYLYVILCENEKPKPKKIHRLVLEAFKPNEDLNKTQCNHIDGNKENNYIENLEWCTRSENIKHAYEIGLKNHKGENHPRSKLTEKKVIEIRIDLKEGILTQKQIGEKFGVDQRTISAIKLNKIWSHVK